MFQILVVEDDIELRELFCTVLSEHGYIPLPAPDGIAAFDILDNTHVDLIVSDLMMPRMDGLELISTLRETDCQTPVLIITARETHADKKKGFRAGTDDYMIKPIDVNEMIWRIEALLRRSQLANRRKMVIGKTELDCDAMTVSQNHKITELPQKEFFLLYKLITSPGRIFTRRQIMEDIWGPDSETDPHTLDVHISRLRERFKDNADFEIVTVRGLGYKAVKR